MYILVLFFVHFGSFMFEYMYQRWCYPLSFKGFFMSLFTRSSTMCTTLRDVSMRMDNVFMHVVVSWILNNTMKCTNYLKTKEFKT